MNTFVQRARGLGESVADAVRRAVDPPLAADARPIEIKRALVEAVEKQVEPVGSGRRMLPGDRIVATVLASADARPALDTVLIDLRERISARLAELQCPIPRTLVVEVEYVDAPPAGWAPEQRIAVRVGRSDAREPGESPTPAALLPALTVTIVRGEAERAVATFTAPVVRLGRSANPTDERGRQRLNDVAFLEDDTPANLTVTRGHATIRFNAATGEYRLYDEGSANGTRVVRAGEILEVPRRDPMGVVLKSGDEVQLGKAAVRIRIE